MRRAALILDVHYISIAYRLKFLAQIARKSHTHFLKSFQQNKITSFQFDDIITIEHTKCKPLSITFAVTSKKRQILGFDVSSMPATGHLCKISLKKYGKRKDERRQGIKNLFTQIKPFISKCAEIKSDEHPFYPLQIRRFFKKAMHRRYKGAKGCVAGQGELKKLIYDPLFSVNHTAAMFRANINRLFRRTWCTTKKPERLADHLAIYMNYHNGVLLESVSS